MITIQRAAFQILKEVGKPMPSREIARVALERGMVRSSSRSPVFSMASTIEKNIRDVVYNEPELTFVITRSGRLIGLPEWEAQPQAGLAAPAAICSDEAPPERETRRSLTVELPQALLENLEFAAQLKLAPTLDDTVALALRSGLGVLKPEIESAAANRLSRIAEDTGLSSSHGRAA